MSLTKITYVRYSGKVIPIGFPVYYDSGTKQYKVQMKCTECGDNAGCMCYDTLDDAAFSEDSLICDKKRCYVAASYEILRDEDMESCIPCVPLNECTQDELDELHDEYIENHSRIWAYVDTLSRLKTQDELSHDEVDELYDVLMHMDFDSFDDNQTGSLCKP